ncbi:hypothetical protein FWH58_00750 [Candidatus Saccharibacteria bacterium]|nr:hypothetical protein [Candidatus Saccharibacteria bacterium]
MDPNQPGATSTDKPAKSTNQLKSKKTLLIAGGGGLLVIAVVLVVVLFVLGGNTVTCSKDNEQYGMKMHEEYKAFFSGKKITKIEAVGTLDSSGNPSGMTVDQVYDQITKTYEGMDITKDGDVITFKETVTSNDSGNFRGKLINFMTIGGDEIGQDGYRKAMERQNYTCK